jgi:hypothetical protein
LFGGRPGFFDPAGAFCLLLAYLAEVALLVFVETADVDESPSLLGEDGE